MTRKTLLHRWFGFGRLPKAMVPILEREGIVLLEEGLSGSVTFRKFRAPGKRYGYRRNWFCGCIVITGIRVAAFAFGKPVINLPLEPARLESLSCSLEKDGKVLCVSFDASAFHDDATGRIECRFRTDLARSYLERLESASSAAGLVHSQRTDTHP